MFYVYISERNNLSKGRKRMKGQRRHCNACARVELWLDAYIDGELNTRRAAFVRRHLADCSECAARAEEHRELSRLVAMSDGLVKDEVSRDLHASIMQSVAQSPRVASKATGPRRASLRLVGALVALVLLCGVLLIPGGPLNPVANGPLYGGAPSVGGLGGSNGSYEDSSDGDLKGDNEAEPNAPDPSFSHFLSRVPAMDESDKPGDCPPGGEGEPSDSPSYDGEGDADNGSANVPEVGIGKEQLEALYGEWKNEEVHLLLNTEAMLFGLVMADGREYFGVIIWQYDTLLLIPDDDPSVMFLVSVKGDGLWLTQRR
jgi:hypothetical protein